MHRLVKSFLFTRRGLRRFDKGQPLGVGAVETRVSGVSTKTPSPLSLSLLLPSKNGVTCDLPSLPFLWLRRSR